MKSFLITGANGFIGRNLTARLERMEGVEFLRYGSGNSLESLEGMVSKADVIIHLAGVNRPQDESEYIQGNAVFTEAMLYIAQMTKKKIPILFASSIQAELLNPYGISKLAAEDAIQQYATQTGAPVYIFRLPNVFGKWCKPNYNSVVATWCHNISRDLPIVMNDPTKELNLVYIDDVVDELIDKSLHVDGTGVHYPQVPNSCTITLGELKEHLTSFRNSRSNLRLANFENELEKKLYSTYLSYLPEDRFAYDLDMKFDNRGWLAEFIKSDSMGQVFVSRTKPGITRGNHWHHTKVEKFLVVEGEAVIQFRHINSRETIEYQVSGESLKVLDIPPGFTHSICNIGSKDVITIFWANEIFDQQKPDTYFLEV